MRTTLTLDEDIAMDLKEYAHRQGMTFKEVVNLVLRQGLIFAQGPQPHQEIDPPTASLGGIVPGVAFSTEDDPDGEVTRFLRVTEETMSIAKSQRR